MDNNSHSHKTKFFNSDFWQGFYAGFTIIAITGFGDKLFFLNMLYASINSFCDVFWVALAISELMNLFNISLGHLLKKYIQIWILEYVAISVFFILGIWLIIKGFAMKSKRLNVVYEEERNLLLESQKKNYRIKEEDDNDYRNIEIKDIYNNNNKEDNVGVFDSWWKYFIAYFLASVGDKSQIATILITSKYNFLSIFNGTAVGILVLVLIAMIFGKTLSGLLTNKQISIICGVFFLLYALIFFVDKKLAKIFDVKVN
jgi:putative Ca2+/H+ antiporter (TMEM165/GDT1 family)